MKNKLSNSILVLIFLAGLSLLLYPTMSNYLNSLHSSKAVADYSAEVRSMDRQQYAKMLNDAQNYNKNLALSGIDYNLSAEQEKIYESLLNINDTGIMGYIEISAIGVSLPIYHGVDDSVLQSAVGHLPWSSLPVGGESTHCILSGHRGLPSAKLFTNLDKLSEGDIFVIRVLDEVFTYEVDQILIVEPEDVSTLNVEKGQDLCTLVTCTPYGINSHRLLVRGHRVTNQTEAVRVTADAVTIEPIIVAPLIALPILLVIALGLVISTKKRTNDKDNNHDNEKKTE